jgi:anti-sigma B factor antagonist
LTEFIEQIERAPLVVKVVCKRLDAISSPQVRKYLAKLIGVGRQNLVLDLSDVDFIDSIGLGTLVFAHRMLTAGGTLKIGGVSRGVMSMLKLTRLVHVFDIFADRDQAIATLRPSRSTIPVPERSGS